MIRFLAVLIYVVMVVAVLFYAHPAGAHSWYDKDCCDDKDCRPATPDEVKTVPSGFDVTVTMFGRTETRHFAKDDAKIRPSQDARFHVCIAPMGGAAWAWYCLYVPGGGV